jgi:hypothetical protein
VYSDEMSSASADELQQVARQEWDRLQDMFIDKAITLEARDLSGGTVNNTRIRVGIYFYSEESPHSDNQVAQKP